ncbi:hypothetical protein D3C81_1801340 [compost metagenome]
MHFPEEIPPDVEGVHAHQVMMLGIDEEIQQTGEGRHRHKNQTDPEEGAYIPVIHHFIDHNGEQDGGDNGKQTVAEPAGGEHQEVPFMLQNIR